MDKRIIVALDFDSDKKANEFLASVDPQSCRVKIGKELFTACGPSFVRSVVNQGFDVFLDLKFHDIPNTVAKAASVAAELGVWMFNVHASGGRAMMEQAVSSLDSFGKERPLLIAVTVLTSMGKADLDSIGLTSEPLDQVKRLAKLTQESGLDGVVCSAAETPALKQLLGNDFCLVTPGIRRPEDSAGDQKRIVGPAEAISNGSSYLVVGRPITQAAVPSDALQQFNLAVAGASDLLS